LGVLLKNVDEQVVLVDDSDCAIGLMEKLEAHRRGALHRAVSVWITDSQGRVLLQQRSPFKYHSPNLWANACCGHPKEGESSYDAAVRRLHEELGIQCTLHEHSSFIYRADVGQGLIEHEFDHLFLGFYEGSFSLNAQEAAAIRWIDGDVLRQALSQGKEGFVAWLPYIYAQVVR
jgi:isopentenyl-diphosphate Delta-isomerase